MAKSKFKTLILLSLLLILIVTPSSSTEVDFDIYVLEIQWDPATCTDSTLTQGCSILPHDKFSIRALLPIKYINNIVGPCNGTFNPDTILPIEYDLNQSWPNLLTGNNRQVWEDEWRNHGSCGETLLDELGYFSHALNYFSEYNFLSILARNSISPDRRLQHREGVEGAISRAIGLRPAIFCNINNSSGTTQFQGIRLCYYRHNRAPLNCWETLHTCGLTFDWFPYMRTYYTHFQVSFQWQPATCFVTQYINLCTQLPQLEFTINGVWPTTAKFEVLGPCTGSNFSIDQISPLRDRLNRGWPDIMRGENETLWENEWSNHGTCSEDQFGQMQYFSLGLHSYETYDIMGMLESKNITPNGERYTRVDFENAIIASTGKKPNVICNTRRINGILYFQFQQIILCYDDYGREIQDCPQGSPVCSKEFYWFS